MSEDIKNKLQYQRNGLNSDAGFYLCLIDRSLMTSTVQRVEEMRAHHQTIVDLATHQNYKMENATCLNCPQVLTCNSKCNKE